MALFSRTLGVSLSLHKVESMKLLRDWWILGAKWTSYSTCYFDVEACFSIIMSFSKNPFDLFRHDY